MTLQEYILKGVVNAALGQEQGSVGYMHLAKFVYWKFKLPLSSFPANKIKVTILEKHGSWPASIQVCGNNI